MTIGDLEYSRCQSFDNNRLEPNYEADSQAWEAQYELHRNEPLHDFSNSGFRHAYVDDSLPPDESLLVASVPKHASSIATELSSVSSNDGLNTCIKMNDTYHSDDENIQALEMISSKTSSAENEGPLSLNKDYNSSRKLSFDHPDDDNDLPDDDNDYDLSLPTSNIAPLELINSSNIQYLAYQTNSDFSESENQPTIEQELACSHSFYEVAKNGHDNMAISNDELNNNVLNDELDNNVPNDEIDNNSPTCFENRNDYDTSDFLMLNVSDDNLRYEARHSNDDCNHPPQLVRCDSPQPIDTITSVVENEVDRFRTSENDLDNPKPIETVASGVENEVGLFDSSENNFAQLYDENYPDDESVVDFSNDQVDTYGRHDAEDDALSSVRSERSHRTTFSTLFSRGRYGAIRRRRKHRSHQNDDGSFPTLPSDSLNVTNPTERKTSEKSRRKDKKKKLKKKGKNNDGIPLPRQYHNSFADTDTDHREVYRNDSCDPTSGNKKHSFWHYKRPNKKSSQKSSRRNQNQASSVTRLDTMPVPHQNRQDIYAQYDSKDRNFPTHPDHDDSEYSTTGSLSSFSGKHSQSSLRRKMESWQYLIFKPSESSNGARGSRLKSTSTANEFSLSNQVQPHDRSGIVRDSSSLRQHHCSMVSIESDCLSITSAKSVSDMSNTSNQRFLQRYRSKMSKSLNRWKKPSSQNKLRASGEDTPEENVALLSTSPYSEGLESEQMRNLEEMESRIDMTSDRLLSLQSRGQNLGYTFSATQPAKGNISNDGNHHLDDRPFSVAYFVDEEASNLLCRNSNVQAKSGVDNILSDSDRYDDVVVFFDSDGLSTGFMNEDCQDSSISSDSMVYPRDFDIFFSRSGPTIENQDCRDREQKSVGMLEGNATKAESIPTPSCFSDFKECCSSSPHAYDILELNHCVGNGTRPLPSDIFDDCSNENEKCNEPRLSPVIEPQMLDLDPTMLEAKQLSQEQIYKETTSELQVLVDAPDTSCFSEECFDADLPVCGKQTMSSTSEIAGSTKTDVENSENAMPSFDKSEGSPQTNDNMDKQVSMFARPRGIRPSTTQRTKNSSFPNMDDDICLGGSESSQCEEGRPAAKKASRKFLFQKDSRLARLPPKNTTTIDATNDHGYNSVSYATTSRSRLPSRVRRFPNRKSAGSQAHQNEEIPRRQRWRKFRKAKVLRDSVSVSEASNTDNSYSSRGSFLHQYGTKIGKSIQFLRPKKQDKSTNNYMQIPEKDEMELPNSVLHSKKNELASSCPSFISHSQRLIEKPDRSMYSSFDGQGLDVPSSAFTTKRVGKSISPLDDVEQLDNGSVSEDDLLKSLADDVKQISYGHNNDLKAPTASTSSYVNIIFPSDMEVVVSCSNSKTKKKRYEQFNHNVCEMDGNSIDDDSSCSDSISTCSTLTTPSTMFETGHGGKLEHSNFYGEKTLEDILPTPVRPKGLSIRDGFIEYSLASGSVKSDSSRENGSITNLKPGKNTVLMSKLKSAIEQHQDKTQSSSLSPYKTPMHMQIDNSSGRKISILLTQSIQKIFEIVSIGVEQTTSIGEVLKSARSSAIDGRLSSQIYVSLCSDIRDVSDLSSPISELIDWNQNEYDDALHNEPGGFGGTSMMTATKNEIMKKRMERLLLVAIPIGSNAPDCQRIRRVLWRNPKLQNWWKSQEEEYLSKQRRRFAV